MATVLRTTLRKVLLSVQTHLVSVLGVSAGRVHIFQDDEPSPNFQAPQDFLITFSGMRADPLHRDRHDRRAFATLTVVVRTKNLRDEIGEAVQWIIDPVSGNSVFTEDVIDALQNFLPKDDAGNHLVFEPMDWLSENKPTKGRSNKTGWGETTLTFALPINLPLTQRGDQP